MNPPSPWFFFFFENVVSVLLLSCFYPIDFNFDNDRALLQNPTTLCHELPTELCTQLKTTTPSATGKPKLRWTSEVTRHLLAQQCRPRKRHSLF